MTRSLRVALLLLVAILSMSQAALFAPKTTQKLITAPSIRPPASYTTTSTKSTTTSAKSITTTSKTTTKTPTASIRNAKPTISEKRVAGLVYKKAAPVRRVKAAGAQPSTSFSSVPLTSINIQTTVHGWAYDVSAQLTYRNELSEAIECQFIFPIADTAAVYKFEVDFPGRKMISQIQERLQARATYDSLRDSGEIVAFLDSVPGSPDVYRLLLGNLPANGNAVVKIRYAMPIERDITTGTLIVNLPVVLNPRYFLRSDNLTPDDLKGALFPNVPYVAVSKVRYSMQFSADIDMGKGGGSQISNVWTDDARDILSTTLNGQKATAVMTSTFMPDHDFRLMIATVQDATSPTVYVEPKRGNAEEGTLLWHDVAGAWFDPIVPPGTNPNDEYWFLVDRSGSMSVGNKDRNAGAALSLFIKSLPPGCFFNVIAFSSTYSTLFPVSVENSDVNAAKAVEYGNNFAADGGGTEILQALSYIYSAAKKGNKRFIVMLTDGEVSSPEAVIDIVSRNKATTTVYAIGIGEGASTATVNGVARVSNGMAEYVRNSQDRLEEKVIAMLKATTMLSREEVSISWPISSGGTLIKKAPSDAVVPTAAFLGRTLMQYAILEREAEGGNLNGEAYLSGTSNGETISRRISFTVSSNSFSDDEDPMPLHRLAAKAILVELTDNYRTSRDLEVKEEAIETSKNTGVLCDFTAFIVADENTGQPVVDPANGAPVLINIERPTVYDLAIQMMGGNQGPTSSKPRMRITITNYTALVQLQGLTGSWSLTNSFVNAISQGTTVTDFKAALLQPFGNNAKIDDETLATLAGVAILRRRFASLKKELQFIEAKALTYLRQPGRHIRTSDLDRVIEAVGTALRI